MIRTLALRFGANITPTLSNTQVNTIDVWSTVHTNCIGNTKTRPELIWESASRIRRADVRNSGAYRKCRTTWWQATCNTANSNNNAKNNATFTGATLQYQFNWFDNNKTLNWNTPGIAIIVPLHESFRYTHTTNDVGHICNTLCSICNAIGNPTRTYYSYHDFTIYCPTYVRSSYA